MTNNSVTNTQWQSAAYLRSITQDQIAAFGLAQEVNQWIAFPESKASSYELHIFGQCLNLEKLWKTQNILQPCLSVSSIKPHTSSVGLTFIASVELSTGTNLSKAKEAIEQVAEANKVDLCLMGTRPTLSQPGLLVMDMDSTVIQVECIDEIAKLAGAGDEVAKVTELAMQGKFDFSESLIQRVGCLKGTSVDVLQQVCDGLPLMPGVENLVNTLKSHGWKIAIASGGFTFFADYLRNGWN